MFFLHKKYTNSTKCLKLYHKKITMTTIFSDLTNEFQILDYSPTHNQLLIRSMKNKHRDHNIDILIKGVQSILIPSTFNGLEISLAEIGDDKKYLLKDYDFKITRDYRIFSMKNANGKTFFLNAMCFGVFHNKLDILETSISRYDMGSLGENILWFAD